MNIIDRFSTHLRQTLARSIGLASEIGNPTVEPIHIFFTLATLSGSVAAEILKRFKLDPKKLEGVFAKLPIVKQGKARNINDTNQALLAPLSANSKKIVEKAIFSAHHNAHNFVGTEHLLLAILEIDDNLISEILIKNQINSVEIKKQLQAILNNSSQFPNLQEAEEVIERMQDNLLDSPLNPGNLAEFGRDLPNNSHNMPNQKSNQSALEFFGTNLTDAKIQENIDPVIGRETEIERLCQILCRRTKNNPVLLGDPGVGKTAIVEGLGKKIMLGQVPAVLLNKKIYALDMGLLIAGTTFRGEFESRLQHVIEEISNNPNIIVFIDELHNIVGAGTNTGTMDASNILKPALARGHIRCVGATTPAEFKKYIENDAALERRFQPIQVKQSSVADSIKILSGIKSNYEQYHNIKITEKAVKAAVELSDRYLTSQFLPDKAIDLLDETAAAAVLNQPCNPEQITIWQLEKELEQTVINKIEAARQDDYKQAVKLKTAEEQTIERINKLKTELKNSQQKPTQTITEIDIAKQLSKVINIPAKDLQLSGVSKYKNLANILAKDIIGQDEVLQTVSQVINRAQLQLSDPHKPMASFMFVGESGVGKTELAKTLAKTLYQNSDALIKLDMSEFNESHSVSKLLGSPAGYVGYKEANQFTDKVKLNPHCVILFDEIDKAHKDVAKLLLQILENGQITDSTGKKISLKHAIIVLTTTVGATDSLKAGIGFSNNKNSIIETNKILKDSLKEYFSTELINRLDKVCLFKNLTNKDLSKIAKLEVEQLNLQLKKYNTKIKTKPELLDWVVTTVKDQKNAREIRSYLRQEIEKLMSEVLLNDSSKPIYELTKRADKLIVT